MRFLDIFRLAKCKSVFDEINEFASTCLRKYNEDLKKYETNFSYRDKDIFDIAWGTVELSKFEICILDSPLLQRLRNIRQLGFADYVYCNASYSRFAHTIGVVEVAGRISKVIKKNIIPGANEPKFDMIEVVRLASIFHDAGHMFFSHVSEKFFTTNTTFPGYNDIKSALLEFNEQISSRAALHEMLSVMIVNSDKVKELLSITAKRMKTPVIDDSPIDLLIDYISGLIVGVAVNREMLPYSKVIKGSVDADRMDYLVRDSAVTRVPLAVDIPRLIKKITVVNTKHFESSRVWIDDTAESYPSMAIQYSAQRLIWQLSMARSILYQSIYFHHKKLTVEEMLRRVCEKIFCVLPSDKNRLSYIMSLTDDVFGGHIKEILFPGIKEDSVKVKVLNEATEIMARIRNRDLYKRAASFSRDALFASDYIYTNFLINIIEDPSSDDQKKFIERVSAEYDAVLKKSGKAPSGENPVFMFVEANWQNDKTEDIPIDFGNGPYKMASEIFKETPAQGEENKQKQYYLVTDQTDRVYVYIALEKVLFRDYNIHLLENSSTCAKFTLAELTKEKKRLFEMEYYRDTLELLSDNIFESLYSKEAFQAVVEKFHSFGGANDSKITQKTLFAYLRQFLHLKFTLKEIECLINGVLKLLADAQFIDRSSFNSYIDPLLSQMREADPAGRHLLPLGNLTDSGARLSYYFNDFGKYGYTISSSIEDVLNTSGNESAIRFFDDGSYSGTQLISMFQELMDVSKEERVTQETHYAKALDAKCKELIKTKTIILAFMFFNRDVEKHIQAELEKLGLKNITILWHADLSEKVFDESSKVIRDREQKELLKNVFTNIGYQILKSEKGGKPDWSEERIKRSALGYNDAQQIVIYDFNVPTFTLTALWQNGSLEDKFKWHGLFQRTQKE
jgi:HD superfamily phosphohydrolase